MQVNPISHHFEVDCNTKAIVRLSKLNQSVTERCVQKKQISNKHTKSELASMGSYISHFNRRNLNPPPNLNLVLYMGGCYTA